MKVLINEKLRDEKLRDENFTDGNLISLRVPRTQPYNYYHIVLRMLTTNLNSINQNCCFYHYVIYAHSISNYESYECKAFQHVFFLQHESQMLQRQIICDLRRLLM
jgi:hypothetical protein